MVRGVRYRVVSLTATTIFVVTALLVANSEPIQQLSTTLAPVIDRLQPTVLAGMDLYLALAITIVAMLVALGPLFKPQPRRILDTVFLTQKRVLLATVCLTSVGYFDYTFRLPRSTLIVMTTLLLVVLPSWFVFIRRAADANGERAIVIGDDPTEISRVLDSLDMPVIGYVSPPTKYYTQDVEDVTGESAIADGGLESLEMLGGLSRLEDIIVDYDVDTAVFAFAETDREEFFGALAKCHDNGVDVKIHREKADSVLADPQGGEQIVDIDLEPWDWQDRAVKRLFDIVFAGGGLLVQAPLILLIAVAIKLNSPGPLLYSQQRTTEFGDTFSIYKFRSMIPGAEADTGATLSDEDRGEVDPRVTRVGAILRQTHLDEIPQLWSVLVGDMSVVGPRPERPELEGSIEQGVLQWRRRWFVRPGLTGLAQINDVTGHDPKRKLRYDVEYIRKQSFRYDVMIVIRQLWKVLMDLEALVVDSR
jgi:lipopolysaccharide/colanic/teichoic acid biosynthesis glycosyltransferase